MEEELKGFYVHYGVAAVQASFPSIPPTYDSIAFSMHGLWFDLELCTKLRASLKSWISSVTAEARLETIRRRRMARSKVKCFEIGAFFEHGGALFCS